jgi:DNA-binding NtrC family response regulator|tara:strand:+ start:762 stop:890 length:129 start_codon:yes stop_codon:yes gene_type:complete
MITKEMVEKVLEESCGNRRLTASRLFITERHLYRLLKKHNLK